MPDKIIPPPPEKPTPHQCCGSGCVPCIYDYYYDALDKWNDEHAQAWSEAALQEKPI
ncbi:MAG: hypothetical protein ACJAQ6_002315 [Arenicella sp.]|jgi:hypothetical protein